MAIHVKNYKECKNDGVVLAYIDFTIPEWGIHLNQCKLIRAEQGGKFIGFPCKKYEVEGETKYAPFFCFDKDHNAKFQKAALDAISNYKKNLDNVNESFQ